MIHINPTLPKTAGLISVLAALYLVLHACEPAPVLPPPSPSQTQDQPGLSPSPPHTQDAPGLSPSPPHTQDAPGLSPSPPQAQDAPGLSPSPPQAQDAPGLTTGSFDAAEALSSVLDGAGKASSDDRFAFTIYEILGTSDAITGVKWDNMLAWRADATSLAEHYRGLVFVNMDPHDKVVYLTFDDGPDPTNTVRVMNTLIQEGVEATFFFTGENIKKHPSVVKQAHDNGFTIGLHGYDHSALSKLSEAEVIDQLDKTNRLLEEAAGERTRLMRPPYGDLSDDTIETIRSQDAWIYLWSLDTLDWANQDQNDILRNITENLRPGEIILMHASAGQPRTAAILPEIITYIRSQGYQMKALPTPPNDALSQP